MIGHLFVPDARRHLAAFLPLFAAGCLLALLAARSLSGSGPLFLLLCGGLLRATMLLRAPDLSDDLSRYAWDARVAEAGISPYAHAPDNPALSGLDPGRSGLTPHADVRTVYPPVAQAAFRVGMLCGGSRGLRAVFGAADLSIVALLLAMGGPGAGYAAALYAFHPLAVMESAGQGHLDALGVALLLASLVYAARRGPMRAGIAFALSVLTKYISLAAVIPLARRGRLAFCAAATVCAAVLWIGATRGGVAPVGGLTDYASRWEFNGLAYPALAGLFERAHVADHAKGAFVGLKEALGHPAWTQSLFPLFHAGFLARAALGLALGIALAMIGWRVSDTETAVFASAAALLLASPTLHPWYLLWILPFAARRREPAFLYLSCAVPLSYALLYPVPWLPRPLVYVLEYAPFAVLLARTLIRGLRPPRGMRTGVEGSA